VPALENQRPPKYKCEVPIIGGLKAKPPAGSRAELLVRGSVGAS